MPTSLFKIALRLLPLCIGIVYICIHIVFNTFDPYFTQTKFVTLLAAEACLAIFPGLVFWLVLLIIGLIHRNTLIKAIKPIESLGVTLLLFALIYSIFVAAGEYWYPGFAFKVMEKISPVGVYISGLLGLLILAVILNLFRKKDMRGLIRRSYFAYILIVLILMGSVLKVGLSQGINNKQGKKHLLLIVLDRLPAQYFPIYNSNVNFESQLFDRSQIYTNMHTSAPYTFGFFGSLYSGKLSSAIKIKQRKSSRKTYNLVQQLQKEGINVQLLVDHRLGTPDMSGVQNSDYSGLKISILPSSLPIYSFLELIFPQIHRIYNGPWYFGRLLGLRNNNSISKFEKDKNRLNTVLLPSLKRLKSSGSPSMLIFHTDWRLGMSLPTKLWRKKTGEEGSSEAFAVIRNNDYKYRGKDKKYVKKERDSAIEFVPLVLEQLDSFFQQAREMGLLDGTMVIITADHGSIFEHGKLWYGFHPNEETLRTFTLIDSPRIKHKIDSSYYDTTDIYATILDHFNIDGNAESFGVSMLSGGKRNSSYSITLRSEKHKEQFLVIYLNDMKYQFNIHEEGDGQVQKFKIKDNYVEESSPFTEGYISETVSEEFQKAFEQFNLSKKFIHKNFKPFLKRGKEILLKKVS